MPRLLHHISARYRIKKLRESFLVRIKKPKRRYRLLLAISKNPIRIDLNYIFFANVGIFDLKKLSFTKPYLPT